MLENIGLGVDIEEIARFRSLDRIRNRRFLEKIFTPRELKYCFSKKDPAPHLAVRFCGKEAMIKALASMEVHKIAYHKIEIINILNGVPKVLLHMKGKAPKIQISLSHTHDYAMACALVTGVND